MPGFTFIEGDLQDKENLRNFFELFKFERVVNLAGQVGARYSLTNPDVHA